MTASIVSRVVRPIFAGALLLGVTAALHAQDAVTLTLTIKERKFDPGELRAPAGKTIAVKIKNMDRVAAEFESKVLKVEKIIAAGGEGTVFIRPQKAGRYEFFDDFNQSAKGVLVVE
jgi:plastocyanin